MGEVTVQVVSTDGPVRRAEVILAATGVGLPQDVAAMMISRIARVIEAYQRVDAASSVNAAVAWPPDPGKAA